METMLSNRSEVKSPMNKTNASTGFKRVAAKTTGKIGRTHGEKIEKKPKKKAINSSTIKI